MALLSDFGWCRWTTAVGAISPVDIADIIAGVVGTEQLVVSRDIAGLLSPSRTMAAASDIGPAACWQTTRRPCLLLLLLLRRPFVFDLWAQSFSYLYRRFLDLFLSPLSSCHISSGRGVHVTRPVRRFLLLWAAAGPPLWVESYYFARTFPVHSLVR